MSRTELDQAAEFDLFASRYDRLLDENLRRSGETAADFTRARLRYLSRRLPLLPSRVMDFGAGIGLAIPHLLSALPGCTVTAVDISPASVHVATERFQDDPRVTVKLRSEFTPAGEFDMVYASGVFHHIEPDARLEEAKFVLEVLRPGGVFVLAEHNPWNPVTRRLVGACAFDEMARLIRPSHARTLLRQAGFVNCRLDYTGFFSGPLKRLRPMERFLHLLPAGAQYVVIGRRGS